MILFVVCTLSLIILCYCFLLCPRFSRKKELFSFPQTQFAHRGYHCAEKQIPENSMAAFQRAIDFGYGIELDLHLTRDHKLVVFHDNTLSRMCHTTGTIEDSTYQELQKLLLLNTTEHIPLFLDVLSLVDGKVPLLIELKIPNKSLHICEEVCHTLCSYHGLFMIQSFNTMGLRWFKYNAPHILRGQLSSNLTNERLTEPLFYRFFVKHLLCNIFGRPDFISYKLSDLPSFSVFLCQKLFKIPVAVWTLHTDSEIKAGIKWYHFQIFENFQKNY